MRDWGGELNVKKTKWMCIRSALAGLGRVAHVLRVNNEEVEQVDEFKYLGSVVASDADLGQHRDVAARVRDASKAFGQLRGLWSDGRVLLSTKRTIFLACVCTTLFWGAETWTQRAPELRMMRRAWYGWLRSILGLTWQQCVEQHISHAELRRRMGVEDVATYAARASARWIGHVARMSAQRFPLQVLFGAAADRGPSLVMQERKGLCRTIVEHFRSIIRGMGVDERCWSQAAQDRHRWRHSVRSFVAERQAGPAPSHRSDVDSLVCSNCGFIARNASGLSRHVNSKHGLHQQVSFVCEHCGVVCGSQSALTRHLTEHAQPAAPAPRARSCARCGQIFLEVGHYNKHVREQCPLRDVPADAGDCRENGLWKCPACSRTFRRPTDFSKHWPRCRVRPELAAAPPCQRDVNARTLPCQFCGSLWAYPSQRARHEVRCPQRPER